MNQWQEYEVEALIKKRLLSIGDGYRAKNSELSDKGIPFARAGNLNGGFDFSNCDYFPKEDLKKVGEKKSQVGDVVFTSKGTVGRFAFVDERTPEFVFSPQLCYWRSLDESFIHPRFLYYWMQSRAFTAQVYAVKGQTDMADYVSLRDQRQMSVTLPEIKTQKEIASIFSDLDQKITLLQNQNQTLEKIAQTLFKHWFIDFEFPNENGRPYRSSGGAMRGSEFGEVPVGWKVKKIKDFGKVVCGKTPSKKISDYYGGAIPFIKIPDMHGQVFILFTEDSLTETGSESQSNKILPVGSVNVSCIATVGLVTINSKPSHTNQQINSVIPNDMFSREYLYFSISDMKGLLENLGSGGSATLNVNTSTFSNLDILFPKKRVINLFHVSVLPLFDKIEHNLKEIQTLTQTRDTLLPKLMSGQIRIKDTELHKT